MELIGFKKLITKRIEELKSMLDSNTPRNESELTLTMFLSGILDDANLLNEFENRDKHFQKLVEYTIKEAKRLGWNVMNKEDWKAHKELNLKIAHVLNKNNN